MKPEKRQAVPTNLRIIYGSAEMIYAWKFIKKHKKLTGLM